MKLLDEFKQKMGFREDQEVAAYLGKHKSTVSKWRDSGELPPAVEKQLNHILSSVLIEAPHIKEDRGGYVAGLSDDEMWLVLTYRKLGKWRRKALEDAATSLKSEQDKEEKTGATDSKE